MKIELHEITVREVAENYTDNDEEGVLGYNWRLDIRPKYQREFVYKEQQRDAVIETIRKGFPLNVMYWVNTGEDQSGNIHYEVLDGQQRTISFCQFVQGSFNVVIDGNPFYFSTLTETERQQILDYKLLIYFCDGTDKEKLDWFRIINIAGVKLEDQELRNAIYTGEWLTDAKRKFSRRNCAAYNLAKNYMLGEVSRQKYLETAIKWIAHGQGETIETYMAKHQRDPNANELWLYFQNVIHWVQATFPAYRKEMKGLEWGMFYNQYGQTMFNTAELEAKIVQFMSDDDVTKKSGIYPYLLTGDEKYLNIRAFTESQKRSAYERQQGICPLCHEHFAIDGMEGDHITPWVEGGKTSTDNLQMVCRECNRRKGTR